MWIENQDLEASVYSLETAIGLRPNNKWAYRILADIYQDTETITQAISLYEKVLEMIPQDVWSKTQLNNLKEDETTEQTS